MTALENLRVTDEELAWLKKSCLFLPDAYFNFLKSFRLYPKKQVTLEWDMDKQDISISMHGRWIDTILYEIPILALVSESYFRFVDTDWDHVGQYGTSTKGLVKDRTSLFEGGKVNSWGMCVFGLRITKATGLPYS